MQISIHIQTTSTPCGIYGFDDHQCLVFVNSYIAVRCFDVSSHSFSYSIVCQN